MRIRDWLLAKAVGIVSRTVSEVEAERRALFEILLKLEWCGGGFRDECPVCYARKAYGIHDRNCALAHATSAPVRP